MKKSFPENPIAELLSIKEGKAIIFTPLTEEQQTKLLEYIKAYSLVAKSISKKQELNDQLKKYHKITFDDILAIGGTTIETRLANSYMEMNYMDCSGVKKRNYKCFVFKNWRKNNITNNPMHQDGSCSWNCLMTKLHHPKYGVVYTVPIELLPKFNIDESN
jgi:hypothetical protein